MKNTRQKRKESDENYKIERKEENGWKLLGGGFDLSPSSGDQPVRAAIDVNSKAMTKCNVIETSAD